MLIVSPARDWYGFCRPPTNESGHHAPCGPCGDAAIALNIQRVAAGAAHLIHYGYDEAQDAVPILPELVLEARLAGRFDTVRVYSPAGAPTATISPAGAPAATIIPRGRGVA